MRNELLSVVISDNKVHSLWSWMGNFESFGEVGRLPNLRVYWRTVPECWQECGQKRSNVQFSIKANWNEKKNQENAFSC